jgi:hypothetical protein
MVRPPSPGASAEMQRQLELEARCGRFFDQPENCRRFCWIIKLRAYPRSPCSSVPSLDGDAGSSPVN